MPIYTAKIGTNADLFPDILQIYVPKGSTVADVTYVKVSNGTLIRDLVPLRREMCRDFSNIYHGQEIKRD